MKIFSGMLIVLCFVSCTSYNNIEDFKERKDSNRITFENNKLDCQEHSNLLAAKAEGSKRAGEILIDKRRYFLGCMKRKGWISKVSK
ncbi:MAG: hypothetical protein VX579_05595 [Nitrospinota bacterium]|nr:hypothetical protein [Nitrospinota bacterium]